MLLRFGGLIFPVLVVHPDELIAVEAVAGQDDEHNEVGNQQRKVKAVELIQPLEGRIGLFLQELHHRAWPGGERENGREMSQQKDIPRGSRSLPGQRLVAPPRRYALIVTESEGIPFW